MPLAAEPTTPKSVSRRILLAAVVLSACIGIAGGAGVGWLVYHGNSQAQINPNLVPSNGGKPNLVSSLAGNAAGSVVTIVTQPATAASFVSGQVVANGVVVKSDGLVLTSLDAVKGVSGTIRVGTPDGHGYDAVIVATDAADGLVALRVAGASNWHALNLATTSPVPGSGGVVVSQPAMGGLAADVTSVAAVVNNVLELSTNRSSDVVGAPVIDGDGNVIGILSATITAAGDVTAANTTGTTVAAWIGGKAAPTVNAMGMTASYLSPGAAGAIGASPGALVSAVVAGGPAEVAGIRVGDIVTSVNGVALDADHPLAPGSFGLRSGSVAKLAVLRGTAKLTVSLTLAA